MKLNMIQTIPGYRVNEYLLVLNPHEELRNRITQVKKEFFDEYKVGASIWGKPHIALVNFMQYEMMEERLMNRLKEVAMGHHPFKVELRDYGSFPSHSIYINVISKEPIRQLVREMKSAQQLMKLNAENKGHFLDEPHIPIARKLVPWQYEKGWLEYSNRHFTGRFIADSMLLLKRRVGDKPYQVAARLEFMNLPVNTRQGALFA